METQTEMVELPQYVIRAITSQTSRTGAYAILSPEEWLDVAAHVYADETIPNPGTGRTYLRRGNLSSVGRGRKATLDIILSGAVIEHSGVAMEVPHYRKVADTFRTLHPGVSIDPAFFNYN